MRRALAFVAALAAVLSLTAPAVSARTGPPVVPFAGSALTYDAPMDFDTSACTLPGAMWAYHSEGPGTFRHLGEVWLEVDHCSKLTSPTAGAFGGGRMVITAANGDQLFLSEEGTFELVMGSSGPVASVISLTWHATGGTGRFVDADGAGTAAGLSDLLAGTVQATFTGEIAYDASNRSS